jgi:hypothetical protein
VPSGPAELQYFNRLVDDETVLATLLHHCGGDVAQTLDLKADATMEPRWPRVWEFAWVRSAKTLFLPLRISGVELEEGQW